MDRFVLHGLARKPLLVSPFETGLNRPTEGTMPEPKKVCFVSVRPLLC